MHRGPFKFTCVQAALLHCSGWCICRCGNKLQLCCLVVLCLAVPCCVAGLLSCHSASPLCLCCSLQVKLMKYICKQLQCKQKVPETERPEALDSYPHLRDWLRTINLRPELIQVGLRARRHVAHGPASLQIRRLRLVTASFKLRKCFEHEPLVSKSSFHRDNVKVLGPVELQQIHLVRKVTLLHYSGKNKVLFNRQIPPGGLKMWFPAYFCLLPGPSLSKWREPFYITLWELRVIFAPIFVCILVFHLQSSYITVCRQLSLSFSFPFSLSLWYTQKCFLHVSL